MINKKYKLIAIDIDGTLLDSSKRIKDETKKDIIDAYNLGVKICISTGRGYPAALRYINELGIKVYLILFNGSIVMSNDGEIIYNKTLDISVAKEVYDTVNKHKAFCCFWSGEKLYFNQYGKYYDYYTNLSSIKGTVVDELSDSISYGINKFIWFSPREFHQNIKDSILSNIKGIDYFTSQSEIIEIVPKNINKGEALKNLAINLGVDQNEIIAIGDDENDISMIKYAKLGVAMANAKEIVKENANYITLSNDENGVGEVIQKFILN